VITARYFGKRLVHSIVLLFLIVTFLFFFFRAMPGSYADLLIYRGADPETVAALRAQWGLDDPLHVQYVNYLKNFVSLDMGVSRQFRVPVWDYVNKRILNSFILIAPAITFAYVVGSLIGTLQGTRRGTWFERISVPAIILPGAFPSFFIAMVLVIVFSTWLGLFPAQGMTAPEVYDVWWHRYFTWSFATHYVLPFTAVVLRYLLLPTMIMRASVVEVRSQDFFRYQRMVGLSNARRFRHLMKNASLPVITLYPVSMTRAIGGLVLIEVVFNWPGIGNALIEAVLSRDVPVVQFLFILIAIFIVFGNFLVDVVYGVIDPRVEIGDR